MERVQFLNRHSEQGKRLRLVTPILQFSPMPVGWRVVSGVMLIRGYVALWFHRCSVCGKRVPLESPMWSLALRCGFKGNTTSSKNSAATQIALVVMLEANCREPYSTLHLICYLFKSLSQSLQNEWGWIWGCLVFCFWFNGYQPLTSSSDEVTWLLILELYLCTQLSLS